MKNHQSDQKIKTFKDTRTKFYKKEAGWETQIKLNGTFIIKF